MSRLKIAASVVIALHFAATLAQAGEVKIDGRTFSLPDGFTIERVAGPPLVDRPIEADFDEQGHLYVTDSSGTGAKPDVQLKNPPHRVVRLEDKDGDGKFDAATVFADKMMFPEGAMWLDGSLYVAGVPSIWKLTADPAGSGVSTARSEWFQGKTVTGCANDLHGPYAGPDGWIYWCKGAFAEQTYQRPGRKPLVTRAAHLLRARPDGSGVEIVMTGGMDNPDGVAFTPGGERIISTTFLQNPAGGHRDGLIHAVYGGIYGKVHDVIDDHPHTSPDVMPVLSHLGPAAACGVMRYESDAFGNDHRDNLFTACFNLRKVVRSVLTPDGSTFRSTDSDFLVCDSLDFHPTDVVEDADGSLLIIDTGGWYKLCCPTSQLSKPDVLGAVYRVRRVDAPNVEDARGLKFAWNELTSPQRAKLLDDPRPAVRKRAISILGTKRGEAIALLVEQLRTSKFARVRLNSVWALTRVQDSAARAAVRDALADADETVRQAAAHSVSVWQDKEALSQLESLLANSAAANRRVAAEALGRLGLPQAVPPILTALADPKHDRVLDHSLTYALIEINHPSVTAAGLASDSSRVRRAALIALDQMDDAKPEASAVAKALTDPDVPLRDTAAWIAARHPEWGETLAGAFRQRLDEAAKLSDRDRDLLQGQLASLAKSPAIAELLATQIGRTDASVETRRLALRGAADARLKEAPPSWVRAISVAMAGDPALLPDVVSALAKLRLAKQQAPQVSEALLRVAARGDVPSDVRLEALSAVLSSGGKEATIPVDAELFAFLQSQLVPSIPATQRLASAQVLAKAALTRDQLLALADAVKAAGPLEIDKLLSAFDRSSDAEVGKKLVASLADSKGLKGVRPDALRTHLAKYDADVKSAAEPLLAQLDPDGAKQRAQLDELVASLPKGDIRRGQAIFNSQKTVCVTCHAIGYVGGNIGPDLTRVGSTRSKRDLLESIIYPSASFVQSYEPVVVVTTNGDNQGGLIRRSDATEVVVITGPQQEVHVPRARVKEIRPSNVSIMPQGLDQQLTKQELADLVEFLAASK
jgi:putative membrane-bound dehydrogenase-like protein